MNGTTREMVVMINFLNTLFLFKSQNDKKNEQHKGEEGMKMYVRERLS
jgi:hypothetical protein